MKKYLVIAGNVESKTDSDTHFISARELIRLYSVPANEWVILNNTQKHQIVPDGLIILTPRFDGIYKIEEI